MSYTPHPEEHDCTACNLAHHRRQVVFPDGPKDGLLAVGEAPGALEDEQGAGFVGVAGTNLDRAIEQTLGLDRDEYARANVVRCRPPQNKPPRKEEVEACRALLDRAIEQMQPRMIVAVGQSAARRLLGLPAQEPYLPRIQDQLMRLEDGEGVSYAYRGRPLLLMPHTSPLAWNRTYTDERGQTQRIAELGRRVLMMAAPYLAGAR